MAGTQISSCYPPNIDPTKATLAYGVGALPRLNRELNQTCLLVRQKALMALCDYLKDPEHITAAIDQGTVELLTKLLFDFDTTVRQKSSECLYVMASYAVGRAAFIDRKVIAPLSCLFHDPVPIVRKNAHSAFARIAQLPAAAQEMIDQHLIEIFILKLGSELDEILSLILETLHYCFKVDVQKALNNGGMAAVTALLTHPVDSIRANAARAIMGLALTVQGKEQAIEEKCVGELVPLLTDDNLQVQINCAGALMRIAVTTKGKYTELEAGVVPHLLELLKLDNREIKLYALKVLTCLSEAPEGRTMMLEHQEEIRDACSDPQATVSNAAERCLGVILWKP